MENEMVDEARKEKDRRIRDAVPFPVRGIVEQHAPEFPWNREKAWNRFWTPARVRQDLVGISGTAHDAGIWVVVQLWRELLNVPRHKWTTAEGQLTDSTGRALREGRRPWSEHQLKAVAAVLQRFRAEQWFSLDDLVRDALNRGRFADVRGPLAFDPYLAAQAYLNGWIGRHGEMTWDSLVFDSLVLVESGGVDTVSPLWGDSGIRMQAAPATVTKELKPGCSLVEWMTATGRTVESVRDEVGVASRSTVLSWRNGAQPHPAHLVALKAISSGLLTAASFPRVRKGRGGSSPRAQGLRLTSDGSDVLLPIGLRKAPKERELSAEGMLAGLRMARAEGAEPVRGVAVPAHQRPALRPVDTLDATELALGRAAGDTGYEAPPMRLEDITGDGEGA